MRKLTDDELQFIIERVMRYALEAAEEAREQPYNDFKDGRALAFYEALGTIRNELLARDCDLKFFGLDCALERVLSPRNKRSEKE
nr:transposase [uncultured Stomatobaculum sp.]